MSFLPDPGENLNQAECQTVFCKRDDGFLTAENKIPKSIHLVQSFTPNLFFMAEKLFPLPAYPSLFYQVN